MSTTSLDFVESSPMGDEPINPFKDLRLRNNLSQYELAVRAGCSKHAVLRLEQGMYPEPLPVLLNYWLKYAPVGKLALLSGYEQFQIETRANNARLFGDIGVALKLRLVGIHPLTYLRKRVGLNTTQVAKKLCISQTVVSYFERHSVSQQTVPEQLIVALQDADYTEQETYLLQEHYTQYREEMSRQQNFELVSDPIND